MRSRKGWTRGGNDGTSAWSDGSEMHIYPRMIEDNEYTTRPRTRLQVIELEEGCPEDYIQPGEQACWVQAGTLVTVLSEPKKHPGVRWYQMIRTPLGLNYASHDSLIPRPATRQYCAEATSAAEAARIILQEAEDGA